MSEEKVMVKFTSRYEVQDEHRGTDEATVYDKGLRKSFDRSSALHFLRRGVAVPARQSDAEKVADAL
ncbi:MAG: hypothetical protein GYB53_15070 [Rhodobacteraceae bacterium]|nr:hypothetical protein [Paracoccaceae bacterium]MBR9823731.1 hypothetical protein [Paracoccaceae bacterium]